MIRAGKNSIAVGLAVLLISVALSFSAQGAPTPAAAAAGTYKSHAEARYLQGEGPIGSVVDGLGSELENNGTQACEPAVGECKGEAFVTSPLDPLKQLTVPVGDGVGLKLGAVNDYANAGHTTPGNSFAATGAVDSNGIIRAGGENDTPPGGATLDLSDGALGPIADAVSKIKLDLGAISSKAALDKPDYTPARDYKIADGTVTLEVPALGDLNNAVGDVVDDVKVADPMTLNATNLCEFLSSQGEPLTGTLPGVDLCDDTAALDPILNGKITGLSKVTGGLSSVTKDGITFNFASGEIAINLDNAVFAATGSHINDLPANTHLLEEILPKLVLNLSPLIDKVHEDLVKEIIDNAKIEGTVGGEPLPAIDLSTIGQAGLSSLLDSVFDGVTDGLDEIGDPLAPALVQIADGLKPVLDLIVNVPDLYTTEGIVSGKKPGEVSLAAAETFYSETALQLVLGGGDIADLRLGTAQVGPNSTGTVIEADSDTQADADSDGSDVDADSDGSDVDADSDGSDVDADSDGNDSDSGNDAQSDADTGSAAADADVTSALPNTGAPNILPLLILALGLIAFGTAVLVNERRRQNKL